MARADILGLESVSHSLRPVPAAASVQNHISLPARVAPKPSQATPNHPRNFSRRLTLRQDGGEDIPFIQTLLVPLGWSLLSSEGSQDKLTDAWTQRRKEISAASGHLSSHEAFRCPLPGSFVACTRMTSPLTFLPPFLFLEGSPRPFLSVRTHPVASSARTELPPWLEGSASF